MGGSEAAGKIMDVGFCVLLVGFVLPGGGWGGDVAENADELLHIAVVEATRFHLL